MISLEKYKHYTKMFDAHQENRNVGSGFYSKPLRFFDIEILLISFSQTSLQDFNERLSF